MKRLKLLLISALFCFTINAQDVEEKITVKTSDLTADQLAKIKLEQANAELQNKLDTYGKWVGVGGEIGSAVREGLNAVVDVSDKFSKTDVGKFTLIMIAWKVIGKDCIRIFLGLSFAIVLISFLIYSIKRTCLPRRVCVENPGLFKYPKKYEIVEPIFNKGRFYNGWALFVYVVGIFVSIGVSCIIMFA